MMNKKIDHIAIAVNNIEKSSKLFEKILNVAASKTEIIKSEKVKTKFFHFLPNHSGFLKVKFCPYFCTFCDVSLAKLQCKINFFPEAHGKGMNSLGYSRPQKLS